jgi:hypothetical protein
MRFMFKSEPAPSSPHERFREKESNKCSQELNHFSKFMLLYEEPFQNRTTDETGLEEMNKNIIYNINSERLPSNNERGI